MMCHQYIDNCQLYFSPLIIDGKAVNTLEQCFESVKAWMWANKLELNLNTAETILS